MPGQVFTFSADYSAKPFSHNGIIYFVVINPIISCGIWRIYVDTINATFVLRQEAFQGKQIIPMDDHVLAAVILFMLSAFIKTVFPVENMIRHIQMMVHDLALSNPFQCWHDVILLLYR